MTRPLTNKKLDNICEQMQNLDLDFYVCAELESNPDVNVHYLSGYPGDSSFVILSKEGKIHLVPWDVQLAKKIANVDKIFDISEYNNSFLAAITESIEELSIKSNPNIAISRSFPYFRAKQIQDSTDSILRSNSKVDSILKEARATKEPFEIKIIRKAMAITNKVIDKIEEYVNETNTFTETDLALFVEMEFRKLGADGLAFPTLSANRDRSWQIHTVPPAGRGIMKPNNGLALIDCGLKYKHYCTDVTIPFVFGKDTLKDKETAKIVKIVENTHDESADMLQADVPTWKIGEFASNKIKDEGYLMPHSLGHGLGLAAHDPPSLSSRPIDPKILADWEETLLKANMVLTIEPGIYLQKTGGFRLENDYLITKNGFEKLTTSRIVYVS